MSLILLELVPLLIIGILMIALLISTGKKAAR